METGTKISLGAHGLLVGFAIFGGPLFNSDASEAIQISEVSIITSADFDAMMSRPPSPEIAEPAQVEPTPTETAAIELPVETPVIETPTVDASVPEVAEIPAPDVQPDVSKAAEPAEPEVVVEAPEVAEKPQEATGSEIQVPQAQVNDVDQSGQVEPDRLALLRPKPRPAPRIDNKVAPKPETDAQVSDTVEQSSEQSEDATKPEDKVEEAAPKESTTEIVTEADEPDPNSAAPVKSARPKGRPSDLVAKAKAAKERAEKAAKAAEVAANEAAAKAAKEAEAKAIADALKAATTEAAKPAGGPPLTGTEKNALVLAVQQCWSPPVGVQNDAELVVVLEVELTREGKLAASPKMIEPTGSQSAAVKAAFRAGRQALIACAPYALPADKYEQWRQIEVVFDPKNMVMK